ncbi:FkbM family methyltransferase [Chryseobacterium sp. Leaf394]|uniref:FkbM family methyltransferase n=1 Tax=Chryseobacterium sp. Leaf394 TaxID=1736361 RepID=UPI0006FEDD70|nr:FkbM family methyltransferase [Chryseobacterium sp. Leaf394]KQS95211.1 hypothetical protein ASG21_17375 [Chryseobacterium sp. Leaf394]
MNNFEKALTDNLKRSLNNNYGRENFDEERFGEYIPEITSEVDRVSKKTTKSIGLKQSVKNLIKNVIYRKSKPKTPSPYPLLVEYAERLDFLYKNLNRNGKNLLVSLVSYRLLGYTKVKLPRNNKEYWSALEKVKDLKIKGETINPNFLHYVLEKFDLNPLGYKIAFFFVEIGIVIDFILEQYAYKENGKTIVGVEKGDVVLDIGGCWGDTALYFAAKTGKTGKVYSFEFIPNNIQIHKKNTQLNPELNSIIKLVENPVSDISDEKIYYVDNGPSSQISSEDFENRTGTTTTISIDDFVNRNKIDKVNFIKMDIEGAEPLALQGAIDTIKKFRPKLAIAIYHSMEDFVNIPKWIIDLNCGYELSLGHYTINAEETIIFAKVK